MVEVHTPSEMNNLSERLNRPCDEHSHAILCNVLFLQLELDLNLIFRFHVMIRLLVYIYIYVYIYFLYIFQQCNCEEFRYFFDRSINKFNNLRL